MRYSIDNLELKNFGIIGSVSFDHFSNINLIIGENDTGKTFLLKALYAAARSMEEYQRGDDVRSINEILAEKLRWTFQIEKLGDLVTKGADDPLDFRVALKDKELEYRFGQDCTRKMVNVNGPSTPKEGNSICIPAKEVLSLFSIILKSRDIDKTFGFDDTYYDLVRALQISPSIGKNYTVFSKSRKIVSNVIDGKVVLRSSISKAFPPMLTAIISWSGSASSKPPSPSTCSLSTVTVMWHPSLPTPCRTWAL